MLDELKTGMRVRWIEEPKLESGIHPNLLVGPQMGEIKRITKNKKIDLTRVLVINKDGKHFHWMEGNHACDILSAAEY